MNKDEKLAVLPDMMTRSTRNTGTRDDGEKYYHFTDTAPEELKDLFLEHVEQASIIIKDWINA